MFLKVISPKGERGRPESLAVALGTHLGTAAKEGAVLARDGNCNRTLRLREQGRPCRKS